MVSRKYNSPFIHYNWLLAISFWLLTAASAIGQTSSGVEEEFRTLQQMAEYGDYKGGIFRCSKNTSYIRKQCGSESSEMLLLKAYKSYFLTKLDKRTEAEAELTAIRENTIWKKDTISSTLVSVYHQLALLEEENGCFLNSTSLLSLLKKKEHLLIPYERTLLGYHTLSISFHKGYLNEVSKKCIPYISSLDTDNSKDSVYRKGKILYTTLTETEIAKRKILLGDFILLYTRALIQNGYIDSALQVLQKQEKKIIKTKNGISSLIAEFKYAKGICFQELDQYGKAEKELRSGLVYAKENFLDHSEMIRKIQGGLIKVLLLQGKREEAEFYNNDISSKVVSYFGKSSLAYQYNNYNDIRDAMSGFRWNESAALLKKFLSHTSLPTIHKFRAEALNDLFTVYTRLHKKNSADSILTALSEQQHALLGQNVPALYHSNIELAIREYTYSNRYKEAEEILLKHSPDSILNVVSSAHPDYLIAVKAITNLHKVQENFSLALKKTEEAIKSSTAEFGDSSLPVAVFISLKAALQKDNGEYLEASNTINQSISIFQKKKRRSFSTYYLEALELQLTIKILQGDYSLAQSVLKEISSQLYLISEIPVDEYLSAVEPGLLYANTGRYNKSEKFLKKLLLTNELTFGSEHKSSFVLYNALADLYIITGNYSEADKCLEKSRKVSQKNYGLNSLAYAKCLVVQKRMYSSLGDAERASRAIQDALKIYSSIYGDSSLLVAHLKNEYVLSELELRYQKNTSKTNHPDLEIILLASLRKIKDRLGEQSASYAQSVERAALFFAIQKDSSNAIFYIKQAQSIWNARLGPVNIHTARLDKLLGKVYSSSAKFKQALGCFEKSRDSYLKLFDDRHPDYVEALGKCAQLYYITGDKVKAREASEICITQSLQYIRSVFPILSEKGKIAYWDKIKEDYEFYKTLTFSSETPDPEMLVRLMDIQLQTKSILLNSTLKIKQRILNSQDSILIALYQGLMLQHDLLAQSHSMTQSEKQEAGINVSELEQSIEKTEKELNQRTNLFSGDSKKEKDATYKTLKGKLLPGEVVLEIIPFRYFSTKFTDTIWYAVLSTDVNSVAPKCTVLKNGKELQTKYLKYYRNCIRFNSEDTYSYQVYWKPLEALLAPTHSTIYLVVDGVYNQLNPETFKNTSGNYLLTQLNVQILTSSKDIVDRKAVAAKRNMAAQIVLLGNPTFYSDTIRIRNISALPGTEIEVKKIDSLLQANNWKTNSQLNVNATENFTRTIQNPWVLHISTHGFFADAPVKSNQASEFREETTDNPLLRSGLLMTNGGQVIEKKELHAINREDGVLTAFEAMSLSLDKTDLVVLSACETGLGEIKIGEGVIGLQRAFQVAGAKTVVMSLFKVSDEVTQKLMLEFYSNWLKNGNKHQAFLEAKKTIQSIYHEPKLWGAFIMIGLE